MKALNLEGKTFNRLTVLERTKNSRKGESQWVCRCECGTITPVVGWRLKDNITKSCKCLQREYIGKSRRLPPGIAERNRVMKVYIKSAKDRGLPFELSEEDFIHITSLNCTYCGSPPKAFSMDKRSKGAFIGNGIDRVNNSLGYTRENVTTCCSTCNRAKDVMSLSDYKEWLRHSYEYLLLITIREG